MGAAFHDGDGGHQGQLGLFPQFGNGQGAAVAHGGTDLGQGGGHAVGQGAGVQPTFSPQIPFT